MGNVEVRHPSAQESAANEAMLERARWRGREHLREIGRAEAEALWRDLRRGSIRKVEGIHVPLSIARQLDGLDRLENVEFRSVNIPLQAFGSRFSRGAWRGCRFEDIVADPWTLGKVKVTDCVFDTFDTGRAYRGSVNDSEFDDCEFRNVRFRETGFHKATFRRVRFEDIRGSRVMWRDCSFDQVTATGTVEIVHFIDCDFQATDLSGFHLVEGTVMNTRGADVTLPSFDDSFAVSAEVFAKAFTSELPTMTETSLRGVASLEASNDFETLMAGSGNGETLWSAALIGDLFDIEPTDADRIVERLRPYRLTRLLG